MLTDSAVSGSSTAAFQVRWGGGSGAARGRARLAADGDWGDERTIASYERRIRELVADDAELQAYIFPMLTVRRELLLQTAKMEKLILD